jgi:hypothetical protein
MGLCAISLRATVSMASIPEELSMLEIGKPRKASREHLPRT